MRLSILPSPCLWLTLVLALLGPACSGNVQSVRPEPPPWEDDERLAVGFVLVEGVYNSEVFAPWDIFHHTVFHTTTKLDPPQAGMRVFSVAPSLEPLRTFEDVWLLPDYTFENAPPIDVLVVPSAEHSMDSDLENEALMDFVRERGSAADWIVSLCDGAFVLAGAGLLDGRHATTFPSDIEALRRMFPEVRVHDEHLVVRDGHALTSAGGARSYDPALWLVEHLYGREVALGCAGGMVIDWDPESIGLGDYSAEGD